MTYLYPVFSIVGTTATGKTELAFKLAEHFINTKKYSGVDIISADSRQVYKGLEVLSGADIPQGFKQEKDLSVSAFTFFQKDQIRLFGVSIVLPDEDWSVAQFQEYALPIIKDAKNNHRAIIIVGGTGLYHEHLFNADPNLHVPPNDEFRKLATTLSVAELQQLLTQLNPEKLQNMNNSDKNNPRRLVRAIEIAQFSMDEKSEPQVQEYNHTYIGLTASLDYIIPKIAARIQKRLDQGVVEEVKSLHLIYGDRLCEQVRTTLGFEQITKNIEHTYSQEQVLEEWQIAEKQYAQRQLTWWKSKDFVKFYTVDQEKDWLIQATNFASD